jgi:predicted permease
MKLFLLLRALMPRALRDAFGDEMVQVFAAQLREARSRGPRSVISLWRRTIPGMVSAAWRERRGTPRRRIDFPPLLRWADVRHAARRLAAARGFTVTAVVTLALCIAANLTIFAVVNSILLRPLPFPDATRLVTIYNTYPNADVMDDGASIANYYERRGRIAAFSSVALYRDDAVIVGEPGSTEREFVMRVTPEFFSTLGIPPMLGRPFRDDEMTFGADAVVILSEPFWRQQFAGDPAAVGRALRINGARYTIVGVLPAGFSFLSSRARIFLPLPSGTDDRVSARRHWGSSSHMLARLAPGATIAGAQSQIDAHNAVMERDDPAAAMMADAGFRSVVIGLQARHVQAVRQSLLLLQAGAAALMLIGLVNLANLLLIRTAGRAREFAVRRAIGARAAHVISAIFGETLLLSVASSVLGLLLARTAVAGLATLGAARLPLGSRIAVDGWTAAVAAAAAPVVAILLALAIGWHALRRAGANGLEAGSRGSGTRHTQRTRHVFAVTQIALSLILLSAATRLGLTLRALERVSPGFDSHQVLSGQVSLAGTRYRTDPLRFSFIDRLIAELRRTPGVVSAGLSTNVPLSGNEMKSAATVQGRPTRKGESPRGVYSYAVAGDYFATMAIPLVEGRYLTAEDVGPASRVCVVDDDFARRYWPSGGAIGQRVFLGSTEGPPADGYTVVGVVGAVKQAALSEAGRIGAVYYPYSGRFDRALFVVVRSTRGIDTMQADLRRIVRGVDPELPVNNLRPMDARITDSLATQRAPATFGALFAGVALLLTALGTYGVLSYAVTQRRREIGVRVALGARPSQVRAQFLGTGLRLLVAGAALGLAGAWLTERILRSSLEALPSAPITAVAIATVVIAVVCLAATVIPARRAARIAPVEALGAQ